MAKKSKHKKEIKASLIQIGSINSSSSFSRSFHAAVEQQSIPHGSSASHNKFINMPCVDRSFSALERKILFSLRNRLSG